MNKQIPQLSKCLTSLIVRKASRSSRRLVFIHKSVYLNGFLQLWTFKKIQHRCRARLTHIRKHSIPAEARYRISTLKCSSNFSMAWFLRCFCACTITQRAFNEYETSVYRLRSPSSLAVLSAGANDSTLSACFTF